MRLSALSALALLAACAPTEASDSAVPARGLAGAAETKGVAGEPPPTPPVAAVPRVLFAASRSAAESGEFKSAFGLLAQRDIVARFEVPAELLADGTTLAHFELLNADGVSHSSKWYAFSMDGDAPASIAHPHFGSAIPVQRATVVDGTAHVFGKIPVAGTNFTRFRLHGTFTATLRLGADPVEPIIVQDFEVTL